MIDFTDKVDMERGLYQLSTLKRTNALNKEEYIPFESASDIDPAKMVAISNLAQRFSEAPDPQVAFLGYIGLPAILNIIGEFNWIKDDKHLIQTKYGNFVWSSVEGGGDNTLTLYKGNLNDYCHEAGVETGNRKGLRVFGVYTNGDVTLVLS